MFKSAMVLAAVLGLGSLAADDLPKSGTILVYEVDKTKDIDLKRDMPILIEMLKKRLDPDGGAKVIIRLGKQKGHVEIILPTTAKDEVLRAKELITRPGSLEFRILANEVDDAQAIAAAKDLLKDPRWSAKLKAAGERGEPPPGPMKPDMDQPTVFEIKLARGEKSKVAYSWAEMGPAELEELRAADKGARDKNVPFFLPARPNGDDKRLHGALFFSRACENQRLSAKERKARALEYFVLARDPEVDVKDPQGQRRVPRMDGGYVVKIGLETTPDKRPAIGFKFNAAGADLFATLTRKNIPDGEEPNIRKRHVAIILDGLVQSAPTLNSEIREGGMITGNPAFFTKREVENLVKILRSGKLPLSLRRQPVSETTIESKKKAEVDVPIQFPDGEPRKMLYKFQLAEAQKHFDARRLEVANLKTPADIAKRQQILKAKFIEALGGFPEKKSPLNAKVVGEIKGDGFRVEKVIFESRPNHHVAGNLYVPDGLRQGERVPGVLVPCGHSVNGKAADAYQKACILMARNGMVVFCYDPIGQGERNQLLDKTGKPNVKGSTSEHTLVGVGALLVGKSTATYRIWDGIRALDYLVGRPEVAPTRLGCTGNSGGGTLTAYVMALDERIACAAPSCYITTLERLFATLGPQDAEQNITGQVAFGMEHVDYVTMRAPRPTLICTGTFDYFDIQGSWTTFREASVIYAKLGYGERVSLFEFPDKHGFSKPRREAAARWMSRWLVGKDFPIKEGDWPIFKDEELQCTRSGQVLEDFKGKSVFHFNVEDAAALAPQRAKFVGLPAKEQTAHIRRLLGLPADIPAAKLTFQGTHAVDGAFIYQTVFTTERGIQVPGRWLVAGKRDKHPVTIVLRERSAPVQFPSEPGQIQNVLYLDLRGLGDTAPGVLDPSKPGFFGVDSKNAFMGIHLNRPLLGQRVYDLLAVINKLAEEHADFRIISVGPTAGPVALHAAALDPRIRSVEARDTLLSWNDVIHKSLSINQLTNVVPGVLKVYDLPELAAMLAPRTLSLSCLHADYAKSSRSVAEQAYAPCREVYQRHKAEKNLVID